MWQWKFSDGHTTRLGYVSVVFKHRETILHGHDCYDTTILSVIHNMSTTCFVQYCLMELDSLLLCLWQQAICGISPHCMDHYSVYDSKPFAEFPHIVWIITLFTTASHLRNFPTLYGSLLCLRQHAICGISPHCMDHYSVYNSMPFADFPHIVRIITLFTTASHLWNFPTLYGSLHCLQQHAICGISPHCLDHYSVYNSIPFAEFPHIVWN